MLQIVVPEGEFYNDSVGEFFCTKSTTLQLEHSLISISKWESKWNKAFLTKAKKSPDEIIDYVRCMTITQNVKPQVYLALSDDNIDRIVNYINAPMTATYFMNDGFGSSGRDTITSELIYCWMIMLGIPFECEKWHLNRLMALIRVCQMKMQPQKKRHSEREIMERNAALNAQRRRELHTKG